KQNNSDKASAFHKLTSSATLLSSENDMMGNIKLNPLDLPEIVSRVGDFLSRGDIVHCLRISKTFHNTLVKTIWKRIILRDSKYPTDDEALQKNKEYIEHLEFHFGFPKEYLALQGCSHLKCISCIVGLLRDTSDLRDLSNLIKAHSSTITQLYFDCSDLREIWEALLECAHLKKLSIWHSKISGGEVELFFRVCKKLSCLDMVGTTISQLPADFLDDDTDTFIFPNINTLSFYEVQITNTPPQRTSLYCLGMLARRCPGLRSLSFHPFQEIAETIEQKDVDFCRAAFLNHPYILKNVSDLSFSCVEIKDEDMAAILRQMTELIRLEAPWCEFGQLSMRELLADEQEISDDGRIVRKRRDWRLCDTVETLKCNRKIERTDGVIQAILSNCPRLKNLSGAEIRLTEIVDGAEWVSAGLTEMRILLEVDVDPETAEGMAKQRIAFRQLGKLAHLEILDITGWFPQLENIRTLDLRLRAGLDELVNLKRLWTLSFKHDKYQQMQLEDATWIANNWPKIKYLRGVVNRELDTRKLVTDLLQSHNIHSLDQFLIPFRKINFLNGEAMATKEITLQQCQRKLYGNHAFLSVLPPSEAIQAVETADAKSDADVNRCRTWRTTAEKERVLQATTEWGDNTRLVTYA
ncbi:hypothetical protein BX616_010223, partial [Lobosporangium transversale]